MDEQKPEWLSRPELTTNPDYLRAVDQKVFLDGLREWSERYAPFELTNKKIAELLIDMPLNQVEGYRTKKGLSTHREMPVRIRLLLVYRLLENRPQKRISQPKNKFSDADIDLIQKYYAEKGAKWLSQKIGKKTTDIWSKANKLGLSKPRRPNTSFTNDEIIFIKRHYKSKGPAWIAAQLNLPYLSIVGVAHKFGLRKYRV